MAFESRFWRSEIKKDLNFLEKKVMFSMNGLSDEKIDRHFSLIEIKLFTVAYALRKLMDTKKFPDRVSKSLFRIKMYKRSSKVIRHWHSFDDCYDLNKHTESKIELRLLCNQFIHAVFFQPMPNRSGLIRDIFFVSDYDKEKGIYCISLLLLIKKIRTVIDLYPKCISVIYNEKLQKDVISVE